MLQKQLDRLRTRIDQMEDRRRQSLYFLLLGASTVITAVATALRHV